MSLCLVQSRAIVGWQATKVTVEVHLANGLPSFTLVGLADVEVKEARERVRCAIQNAGLEFPNNKRITVNLAPADLPKDSGRFDLPIALGILAASGQVDAAQLGAFEFAGELSLSGDLRPVRGALSMALALHDAPRSLALVLPFASAGEAALVPGAEVYGARHLKDVAGRFAPASMQTSTPAASQARDPTDGPAPDRSAEVPHPQDPELDGWMRIQPATGREATSEAPDLADVRGHAGARRALEIAAAGGHSLLMLCLQDPMGRLLAHLCPTMEPHETRLGHHPLRA